jgi:hypothetical protein
MYKDALTAVEQSTSLRVGTTCAATEDNIDNLRMWARECKRTHGARYGESTGLGELVFRGFDSDTKLDWIVFVEVSDVPA